MGVRLSSKKERCHSWPMVVFGIFLKAGYVCERFDVVFLCLEWICNDA